MRSGTRPACLRCDSHVRGIPRTIPRQIARTPSALIPDANLSPMLRYSVLRRIGMRRAPIHRVHNCRENERSDYKCCEPSKILTDSPSFNNWIYIFIQAWKNVFEKISFEKETLYFFFFFFLLLVARRLPCLGSIEMKPSWEWNFIRYTQQLFPNFSYLNEKINL